MSWYWILGGLLALYVIFDGSKRKLPGGTLVGYAVGVLLLWPIVAPLYFARRPLQAGAVRKGGTFWVWVRGFIAIWTLLIIAQAIFGFGSLAQDTASGELTGLSAFIGGGVGTGILCGAWIIPIIVLGVLGLVTRTDNVEQGPTGPLAKAAARDDTQAAESEAD